VSSGGLHCGLSLIGLSPRYYSEIARAAEAAGFESIWLPDHLVFPTRIPSQYPYSEDGNSGFPPSTPLFDPWVALSYVASATSTLRLGTHVYVLPLRHPFVTARSLVTLDRLSGGRVILGAGVGWLEPEYTVAGQDFHTRGQRMDEIIPLLRRLWSEPEIEHRGDHYSFDPVTFEPKPLQKPCIPIHIGGASAAALRRAGRLGDGYIDIGSKTVDDLAGRLAEIEHHRHEAGRSGTPFEVTVSHDLFGDPARHRQLAALGVARVLAHAWQSGDERAGSLEAALAFVEWFGDSREDLGFGP
jgi:probable F420-dependent oxidoreductase